MRGIQWVLALSALCPAQAQQFPASVRQQDLNYVATQIPKLHANFFYQLDPAAYQAAADALATDLPTMTDAEFYVRLAALVAMAADPHTAIYLDNSAAAAAGFQHFPLVFRWLDDGVFVTAAAAPYARALRTQLAAIGGTPIDQALQQLGGLIPHSNQQWLEYYAARYLRGQQILQGLHIAVPGDTTPLTFRTAAGETFTLDVAPGPLTGLLSAPDVNTGPYPWYLASGLNYWFGYSASNRLLYFKYNACVSDPANPFTSFAAGLLAALDANRVDTVVLDLRGNVGGDSSVWQPLVDGLSRRIPALMANSAFRAYGVIDKGTFSSGSLDAMLLRGAIPQVRMIGEPTGGAAGGWGNVIGFALPGSGLVGQYSTKWIGAPSYVTQGPDYQPDILIGTRSTDFFARHDPALAAIMARTDNPIQTPSGTAIAVNAASYRPDQALAPGSLAAVFGAFSTTPDQVLINGAAAKLLSVAPSQVNFIVPASAAPGRAVVAVLAGGAELATGQVTVVPAAPGVLLVSPTDASQPGAVENQDNSVNSSSAKAARGSVVQIYATGNGPLDQSGAAPVTVMVNNIPAKVLYSAPVPAYPGLWLIDAQLPDSLTGQVPFYLISGNLASNPATIWIQ
jgi:uncharacterized protein (TIGR03437 family)